MIARLIFFIVAVSATIGSAIMAALIVAVAGLSAKVPAVVLITLSAGTATATLGAAVAMSAMAASLFFSAPEPPSSDGPALPPASARQ